MTEERMVSIISNLIDELIAEGVKSDDIADKLGLTDRERDYFPQLDYWDD